MIQKVTSGGQTGVDQAALRAAKAAGIPTGGYTPRDWLTEDGPAPWLADYGLVALKTPEYQVRTRACVLDADGTLIVAARLPLTGGTALTDRYCHRERKPSFHVAVAAGPDAPGWAAECAAAVAEVVGFVERHAVRVLNVAGPRESKCPGIGARAEAFLSALFTQLRSRS